MKWENLSKLVNIVKEELNKWDSFMAKVNYGFDLRSEINDPRNVQILQEQKGTFRTNCMDCLDRTNVVQGVFSRYVAHEQLQQLNLIPRPVNTRSQRSAFEKFPDALENVFREGWTDNADVMSYLYTGTPALKTDFTRTGRRTYKGAMNDGINSVTRYFINNFTDGYYHDCLDLSTLQLTATSKLRERKAISPIKLTFVLMMLMTVFAKYFVENHVLTVQEYSLYTLKQKALHAFVILGTFMAGLYSITQNGRKFIDDASRYV